MARTRDNYKLNKTQQKLAADNLNLARKEAWRYQKKTEIEYSVLQAVAFLGLCQAAYAYDPEMPNKRTGKPMKFSSIAVPYIRGSILHYIRDRTYMVRLSHRMRENWLQGRRLLQDGSTDLEIAAELGIDLVDWLETRVVCSGPPLELEEHGAPVVGPSITRSPVVEHYLEGAKKALEGLSSEDRSSVDLFFRRGGGSPPAAALARVDAMLQEQPCSTVCW